MTFIDKLDKLFGDHSSKFIKKIQPQVAKINSLEPSVAVLSDDELKHKTIEFRERIAKGETLDDLLPEAYAVVREVSKRVLGQRHYDVQLMGGIVLHSGAIAEMRTGEGKTLTATAPVYLNALSGQGVHLVTVNDYLARRDCSWMGQVYDFLGLTVGCIQNQLVTYVYDSSAKVEEVKEGEEAVTSLFKVDMDRLRLAESRGEAYKCDITYGTNNEFGFDYLRDNMVQSKDSRSQRGQAYAIIDEVDSILIDEARTPLIISAPDAESTVHYQTYKQVVDQLVENQDYNIDEKMKSSTLTDVGHEKITQILNRDPWKEMDYLTTFHIEAALRAKALFKCEVDYVVQNNEVVIVDEFTGRLMPGRRFSEGLHQALEAKEGVTVQKESKTLATITFQNLFRQYKKLSGMTGTAYTEKEELLKIYGLDVIIVPTNKNPHRIDLNDLIYKSEKAKYNAVVEEVKKRSLAGQPVLIGTISIEKNEELSRMLDKAGVVHNVLNAKNHEKEAETIAQAGKRGQVTLATNMAGRGVDILLGGNPATPEATQEVRELGGLHVIGTERHESRRIDNQLRGRAGRQGDPGSTQFFVSLEDDLMRIFGSDRVKSVMESLKIPDSVPIENVIITKTLESAQKKVEGHNFDLRKRVVEFDDVINKQRKAIYELRNSILDVEGVTDVIKLYRERIMGMVSSEIEAVVLFHTGQENENRWDLTEVYEVARTIVPLADSDRKTIEEIRKEAGDNLHDAEARTHVVNYLISFAAKAFDALESGFDNKVMLEAVLRGMMLRPIDQFWVSHLDDMEHLRTGIGLRGYGQKDPLVEYKREAFGLYNSLLTAIQKQVAYGIFKIQSVVNMAPSIDQIAKKSVTSNNNVFGAAQTAMNSIVTNSKEPKVGRNDLCPCGSGLKYKKCHGK